jgi:hypothetical protein
MNWEPSGRFDEWQGCLGCIHYRRGRCAAYPGGIPLPIASGEVDHMVERPGQVGDLIFEPMDFDHFVQTGERIPQKAPAPAT